jgi:hypothetical protein
MFTSACPASARNSRAEGVKIVESFQSSNI